MVVGDVGVAAPAATLFEAAQAPPVTLAALTFALFTVPRLAHSCRMDSDFGPDAQARSVLVVATRAEQLAPAGLSHVHAVHARVSVAEAKAVFFIGYPLGQSPSPGRAMQSVSGCCGSDGFAAQTWPAPHAPAAGAPARQSRNAVDHASGGTVAVGCGEQLPPDGRLGPIVTWVLVQAPNPSAVHAGAVASGWSFVPQVFAQLASLKKLAIGAAHVIPAAPAQVHPHVAAGATRAPVPS